MEKTRQDYSVWSVIDPSLSCNNKREKDKTLISKQKVAMETTYLDYSLPEYEQEMTENFMPSSIFYENTFSAAAKTAQKARKKESLLKCRRQIGSPFTETETSSEEGDTLTIKDDENAALLKACLEEAENIEKELFYHKNSIFKEKLVNLEKELLSIEKYQHKLIKKADKEQEKIRDKRLYDAKTFRDAQLEALNKTFANDLYEINKDVQTSADNIRKAITSSIPSNQHNHKRLKLNPEAISKEIDKDKDKSPSPPSPVATSPLSSTENQTSIAIKKKMSTFQAIEERRKAIYSMKEINKKAFNNNDETDLENDLMKMRKKITQ